MGAISSLEINFTDSIKINIYLEYIYIYLILNYFHAAHGILLPDFFCDACAS